MTTIYLRSPGFDNQERAYKLEAKAKLEKTAPRASLSRELARRSDPVGLSRDQSPITSLTYLQCGAVCAQRIGLSLNGDLMHSAE
jgi:hypothetical protein